MTKNGQHKKWSHVRVFEGVGITVIAASIISGGVFIFQTTKTLADVESRVTYAEKFNEKIGSDVGTIKTDIRKLKVEMGIVNTKIDHLTTRMNRLEAHMDSRFDELDKKLDRLLADE